MVQTKLISAGKKVNDITVYGEKLKRKVGLWIDHRKAVIVSITGDLEEIKSITSDMEKHVRFSGGAQKDSEEDQRDRRFAGHLNKYYDEVITFIKNAESILIVGPGEAKVEFKKRFESEKQIGKIVGLETAGKMTNHQIAAKVRGYYSK
jgi:stalled ribosome rescue protein Dom34